MEARSAQAVKAQNLPAQALVIAQEQRSRTGAGVRDFQHLDQRRDVLVPLRDLVEGFQQVEDHVGLEFAHLVQQWPHVGIQAQQSYFVAVFQQGAVNVVLGVAVVGIGEFFGVIVVAAHGIRHVKNQQHAQAFTHACDPCRAAG